MNRRKHNVGDFYKHQHNLNPQQQKNAAVVIKKQNSIRARRKTLDESSSENKVKPSKKMVKGSFGMSGITELVKAEDNTPTRQVHLIS